MISGVGGIVMAACWHWGMLYSAVVLCCDAVMFACLHACTAGGGGAAAGAAGAAGAGGDGGGGGRGGRGRGGGGVCVGNAGVRTCVIELCFYVLIGLLCCYVGIWHCDLLNRAMSLCCDAGMGVCWRWMLQCCDAVMFVCLHRDMLYGGPRYVAML